MNDRTQRGEPEIHSSIPEVYLSQIVGAHSMDGTELITIEMVNADGSVVYQNFPIPIAMAISDKMMMLCIESQMREVIR
jgi:hypothetical protein